MLFFLWVIAYIKFKHIKVCSFIVDVLKILFEKEELLFKSEYIFNRNSGEYSSNFFTVNILSKGTFNIVSFSGISSFAL